MGRTLKILKRITIKRFMIIHGIVLSDKKQINVAMLALKHQASQASLNLTNSHVKIWIKKVTYVYLLPD